MPHLLQMEIAEFLRGYFLMVSAVFIGNMASLAFAYAIWFTTKAERAGKSPDEFPRIVLLCGLLFPIVGILPIWLALP